MDVAVWENVNEVVLLKQMWALIVIVCVAREMHVEWPGMTSHVANVLPSLKHTVKFAEHEDTLSMVFGADSLKRRISIQINNIWSYWVCTNVFIDI